MSGNPQMIRFEHQLTDEEAEQIRKRLMACTPGKLQVIESEPMVKVTLIPVEFFGECETCDEEFHYGIADAVGGLSDCNSARGQIYRREHLGLDHRYPPDDVITAWVPQSEMWKFDKKHGEEFGS